MATKKKPAKPATGPTLPKPATTEKPTLPAGPEGWGILRRGDRFSHYYRGGNALCNQVTLYRGDLEADTGQRGPDDCPLCTSALAQIGTPRIPDNG